MQLSNSYEGTPGVRILKETKFSLIFHPELKLRLRKFSIVFICRTYFILSILYFKSPRFIYIPHSNSLTFVDLMLLPLSFFLAKVQNYRLLRLIHIPEQVQSTLLLLYDFYFLFLLRIFPNFLHILINVCCILKAYSVFWKRQFWDFPNGPVIKILLFDSRGADLSFLGWGAKIPQASWPKSKQKHIKHKQYDSKLNKVFKIGPHQEKKKKAIFHISSSTYFINESLISITCW